MGTLCGGVDFLSTPSGVWGCGARRIVRRGRVWEMFRASERDLLLATVPKVGKSTGRNLRFLHFRTRYSACRSRGVYHAFAGEFPFRFVKRIVSAPAPLPLIPTPNNAFGSTVENVSGSGARGADDSSYVTISTVFCERVGYGIKFEGGTACRKSRNLGFWLSFWVFLGQRPKVPRPRRDETPLTRR